MRTETRPFDAEHLDAAGRLLAARHRRHREACPLLDPRWEDAGEATALVAEVAKQPDASGAVAVRGGEVVGYVLGAPKDSPAWGPNVWVESAGQAVALGEEEALRDTYAAAAARWVEEGRTTHYVLTPAADLEAAAAWFRVGFGHQHTHALREPDASAPPPSGDVVVRLAEPGDLDALAALDVELPRHQTLSPCFSRETPPTVEEARTDLAEDWDDPRFTSFVAEHRGQVVGSAVGCDLTLSSSHTGTLLPASAGFLGFAAVRPDARGLGAGRALGEAVLRWCHVQGFPVAATDWRQTNLLSSRAWPALGFEDSFWRLHRTIGFS